jgi:hypothetical protein
MKVYREQCAAVHRKSSWRSAGKAKRPGDTTPGLFSGVGLDQASGATGWA